MVRDSRFGIAFYCVASYRTVASSYTAPSERARAATNDATRLQGRVKRDKTKTKRCHRIVAFGLATVVRSSRKNFRKKQSLQENVLVISEYFDQNGNFSSFSDTPSLEV